MTMDTTALLCEGKIHVGKGQGRRSLGWDSSGNEVYCEEAEDVADSDEYCCCQLEWDLILKKALGATSWRALIGNLRNVEFIF